jgi:thioredoxin 1
MDDELARIREKKIAEMQQKMEQQKVSGGVIHIDEMNFRDIAAATPRLVIDFWAEWCGPCRRVGPVIEELSHEYAGVITFGKCNTDENGRLAMQFGISAIPTIIFFSQGRKIEQVIGAYPKEALRQRLIKAFGLT